MNARFSRKWIRAVAAMVVGGGLAAFISGQTVATGPKSVGPIAVTPDSYPQLAVARTQQPVNLAELGYVEEEFIVSGSANVYRWMADGAIEIKAANAPYTTRLLIRRPADPKRFSGAVMVELLNEARGYDWSFVWALSYQHFMERGDVFVGLTHVPENIDALKKFNPARYSALSFANPKPAETCGAAVRPGAASSEEGLRWDAITQVGRLLKAGAAEGPLAGFRVERVYLTSHHGHAVTYAITMQSRSKLANGKAVYDGFLIKSSDNPMRLSRCDAVPPNGDPRQVVRNVGVPVIRVVPQGEIPRGNNYARSDSDEPGDQYRLYEVPGAPRMDRNYFQHLPIVEDQLKSGQPASEAKWPFEYRCGDNVELVDYPGMRYTVDAAIDHLDAWVRSGTLPPHAARIAVSRAGTGSEVQFENDAFGNVKGGARNPAVDVPRAAYVPIGPGQCSSIMTRAEFDRERFASIYGSLEQYVQKVIASVDALQRERWLTDTDAMEIKANAVSSAAAQAPRNR